MAPLLHRAAIMKKQPPADLELVVAEVDALEGRLGDAEQRLWRPLDEPVDRTAVDQRRKHSTARPERAADRTHTQHDVQVVPVTQVSKPTAVT